MPSDPCSLLTELPMAQRFPQALTCYVSGVHSGPNPSPGLGVARSLRQAFPHARLVAVDYSVESSGLHSEVFDEVWVQRPWKEMRLPVYQAAIQAVLDGGALWFPGQDLEVEWMSGALPDPARAMLPPIAALEQVAKPAIFAAEGLPVSIPEWMGADRSDWDLHAFCREHGWRVWLKGPNYEAMRVRDWPSFRYGRDFLSELWGTEQLFLQRHVVGAEESVAFCAYRGELLDCVHMTKHTQTAEGKTWAGAVNEVEPGFAEALRARIDELNWTGGGELEYVRALDGTLHLIDWNPRFPAWIHAASFAGHNLPALLVEAAGMGTPQPAPFQTNQFTRIVLEVPVRNTHPLPAVRQANDHSGVGSKHPSGMTELSRRLRENRVREDEPARPGPVVVPAMASDLEEVAGNGASTPRRMFLPRTSRERFAQVEAVLAAQPGGAVEVGFGYSVKTNPHPTLLALADQAGMFAEVISSAEMRRALEFGFPPERIIMNGPASQWPDGPGAGGPLMAAFADSPQAFERWMCHGPPEARYLGIRLRPVTFESRFGSGLGSVERFAHIVKLLKAMPAEQEMGLHFHFASDVLGPARWREVFEGVVHWAAAIEQSVGRPVRCLDMGGGYFPDDFDRELLPRIGAMTASALAMLPELERFFLEPGKAMAQPSMALATTVLEVRRGGDGHVEAVVDAAISDLPMAPFYPHRVYRRTRQGEWEGVGGGQDRLVGRICMETDILASDLKLPEELKAGDRLVIGDAGAYDASMAYNFGRGLLEDACC